MRDSGLIQIAALVAFLGLVACEPADQAGGSDSRARLDANNASVALGDHRIHVNAMVTGELTPEVAQGYGIQRSANKGFVNLVVLTGEAGAEAPVAAEVTVSATNLTGQLKSMTMREIVDGASVYYIGEVDVDNRETINFDFDVRPADSNRVHLIRYTHQFYTK